VPHLYMYLPYLPLDDRLELGGWQFVPADCLSEPDASDATALKLAQGLVTLYERPPSFNTWGAFACRSDGKIGDEFPRSAVTRLRRSLVVTLLDQNESGVRPQDERDPNAAWRTYTSEHAQAWGHPIDGEGWVAEQYGGMVTILAGGYNVLQEDSIRFSHPRELHSPRPVRALDLDLEYGTALYHLLDDGSAGARRLGRAIDWLDVAWRNSDALDLNLRIAALHSGFETLLDVSANYKQAARSLSALLDPADVERRGRPDWKNRQGNPVEDEISDLEWWFVQFAYLRNRILHGDEITSEDHHDDLERAHLWVAEETLRRAIRATVAAAGWPELRLDVRKRELERAIRNAGLDDPERR
jgi:hypothetical protein